MKNFIAVLFIGCSAIAYSQNKLSGIVSDQYNQPLPGVSVYAPDLHKGTITDAAGQYIFNNLPTRSVRVNFSYMGFLTSSQTIVISEKETIFNFFLVLTVEKARISYCAF